jgi:L-ribulose-5-phosphate 3-epimerase
MIKAISYWSAGEDGLAGTLAIQSALDAAKAASFAGLELCIASEGALNTQMSQADYETVRSQIDQSGLVVQTVACGITWGCNPTSNDSAERAKSIQLHCQAIERTAWLGCDAMLFIPGVVKSPISPDIVRYDHAVARAREAVEQVLAVAEKVGVDLCLENVWNGLFYSPVEFVDFIDSFASDRLGVYFDVGNVLGYHQHPPHWIELLGKRIKRVHIKDFNEDFNWTGSYSFCDLGAGQVPWPETMAALREIEYDQTMVGEMLPWDENILERTSKAMDRILAD